MAKQLTFTRYLYNADEVLLTCLTNLLLKKDLLECCFWISEYYYSGFKEETWQFIWKIYFDFYAYDNIKWKNKIKIYHNKWKKDEKIDFILTIIKNLLQLTSGPMVFLYRKKVLKLKEETKNCKKDLISNYKNKKHQELFYQIIDKKIISKQKCKVKGISKKMKKYIEMLDKSIEPAYKTLKYRRIYLIKNNLGGFKLRRDELENNKCFGGKEIKGVIYAYWYSWEYYANFSPIWKKRFKNYKASFNEEKEIIWEDLDLQENFYEKYGYEPDEQPRICHYKSLEPIWGDLKSWIKDIYNIDIKTKKSTIRY